MSHAFYGCRAVSESNFLDVCEVVIMFVIPYPPNRGCPVPRLLKMERVAGRGSDMQTGSSSGFRLCTLQVIVMVVDGGVACLGQ